MSIGPTPKEEPAGRPPAGLRANPAIACEAGGLARVILMGRSPPDIREYRQLVQQSQVECYLRTGIQTLFISDKSSLTMRLQTFQILAMLSFI